MKQRLFVVLSLALVLLVSLGWAGDSRAQSEEEYPDVAVLLADHPEIISLTMSQVGITANTSNYFPGYSFTGEEIRVPFPHDPEAWYTNNHHEWFSFEQDMESSDQFLSGHVGSEDVLVYQAAYMLEGLDVRIWQYSSDTAYIDYSIATYGMINIPASLPYAYDRWYTFTMYDSCVGIYGYHMPDMEDVIAAFLANLKSYGFRSPAELSAAVEPTPTPFIYVAPILPIDEEPGASPDDLEAVQATQMDPSLPPAMTAGAALGALLGLLLTQAIPALTGRARLPAKPTGPVYYSPATGKPAPLEQVQQEQSMMDSGYVYRDGDWHAPKGEYRSETPAYATRQAEQARTQVRANFQQWKAESQRRIQAEKANDIRTQMKYHQMDARAQNRKAAAFDVASSLAKETAGTSLDIVTSFLSGKIPIKKSARIARYLVDEAVQQGVIIVKNVSKFSIGEKTSYWQDQKTHLVTKFMDFIPGLNADNPTVRQLLIQENIKQGVGKTVDYGMSGGKGGE